MSKVCTDMFHAVYTFQFQHTYFSLPSNTFPPPVALSLTLCSAWKSVFCASASL